MSRQICSVTMGKQPKLRKTSDAPIQLDESLFSSRLKYNMSQHQKGDKRRKPPQKEDDNIDDKFKNGAPLEVSLDGSIPDPIRFRIRT